MLPFCSKFPYLNSKIKSINKLLLTKNYTITDEMINVINDINKVNCSDIAPIPQLDELYDTVCIKNEMPKLLQINQVTSELFMRLFILVSHKYQYKITNLQHLFELDSIWEYLPWDIKEIIFAMVMNAFSLDIYDIHLLLNFIDSINLQVNPFILSNKLEHLKKSINSKK